jgi:hypothetical protein
MTLVRSVVFLYISVGIDFFLHFFPSTACQLSVFRIKADSMCKKSIVVSGDAKRITPRSLPGVASFVSNPLHSSEAASPPAVFFHQQGSPQVD